MVHNLVHVLLYNAMHWAKIHPHALGLLQKKETLLMYRRIDEEFGIFDLETNSAKLPKNKISFWVLRELDGDLNADQIEVVELLTEDLLPDLVGLAPKWALRNIERI
jgi:hypothetical protein